MIGEHGIEWVRLLALGRPLYVVPIAVAGMAGAVAAPGATLRAVLVAGCGLFALGMASWTANEIADRGRDSPEGGKRLRGLYVSGGTGLLASREPASVGGATVIAVICAVIGLALLSSLPAAATICGALFLSCGLLYSFGPVRLKRRGVFGASLVASACGGLAFLGGWFATGAGLTLASLLGAIALSLACLGSDAVAHALDIEPDIAAGDRTIAVALGRCHALKMARLLWLVPVIGGSLVVIVRGTSLATYSLVVMGAALLSVLVLIQLTRSELDLESLRLARVLSVLNSCALALLVMLAVS